MNDLCKRLFDFSIETIILTRNLPDFPEYWVISYQLVKSSTSSGANYEEAQAGSSKADFTNKVRIALREMRESNYWLRIIHKIIHNDFNNEKLDYLINESKELKFILGSILTKMRNN